jgi:uncharacterized membrane protein
MLGTLLTEPERKFDPSETNAIVHFYRGEIGRLTAYRLRLDTTTNWAVGSTAASITFALGSREVPHYVFFVPVLMGWFFLWLEATRYRIFAISQERVSLVERGFYVPLLTGRDELEWREALAATLAKPRPLVSYRHAFGARLRRVYLWLFGTIFLAWLVKLHLLGGDVRAATVFGLPGWVVVLAVSLSFVPTIFVAVRYRIHQEG